MLHRVICFCKGLVSVDYFDFMRRFGFELFLSKSTR